MKTLGKVLLRVAFLFGLTANVYSSDAFILDRHILDSYSTTFGNEKITFEERISYPAGRNAVLNPSIKDYHIIVETPGKTVRYMDLHGMDFIVDEIKITKDSKSKRYYKSTVQDGFLFEEAQRKFYFYLDLIKHAKINEVLGN